MKCRIHLKREQKDIEYEFSEGERLSDMLLAVDLVPDTVIVFSQGVPVPEDELITEGNYLVVETASRG